MKLLVIAPCDRIINDPTFGNSLIAVFHEIQIKLPPGSEVPASAMIPRDWSIFSKYYLDPEEEGKEYYSITKVFWPSGEKFAEISLLSANPKNGMAFAVRLQGAPIGQNGKYRIEQSIHINGNDEFIFGPVESYIAVNVTYDLEPINIVQTGGTS
jgi:hypothetical protein